MKNDIKILVVDDDRASGQAIAEVIKRLGYKSVLVNKPADALNIAKLQTVHAAVVDVLLPKMSGVELAAEFRKTKFADAPIILVSGVFKDKNFAADAIKKCDAKDFLFKPYNADELAASLNKALESTVTNQKWSPQSLLMRKLSSPRDRAKAIENLESVKGQEFPIILGVLMEAELSGSLNIVNEAGEIFGITLTSGAVSEVDSQDSQTAVVLALISHGFLSKDDWSTFEGAAKKKRFSVERLVQEGLVSPHAVSVAKREQILSDFKLICSAQHIQVNFVPHDEMAELPKHAVSLKELLKMLASSMGQLFPRSYLEEFYSSLKNSPMHLTRPAAEVEPLWRAKGFSELSHLRTAVEQGGTLDSVLTSHLDQQDEVYSSLHYMVLGRVIMFDDVQKAKSMISMLERYRKLLQELKGRTPDRVFEYFGARDKVATATVEKIYAEYVRSNHPDQLPKGSPAELVDLCKQCFALMTAAKDVMIDEEKRAKIYESRKQESSERAKRSSEITANALELLRKGQFSQAAQQLDEAQKLHASNTQFLILVWARVKANGYNKAEQQEVLRKLEGLPPEDRRTAYFSMALGMVKKALGDVTAQAHFERVLQMDPGFVEARRELNSIAAPAAKEKKIDLLTGDISDIVSGLFRRKAE